MQENIIFIIVISIIEGYNGYLSLKRMLNKSGNSGYLVVTLPLIMCALLYGFFSAYIKNQNYVVFIHMILIYTVLCILYNSVIPRLCLQIYYKFKK